MENKLSKSIITATKWSTITEFLAKIIVPITTLILARLLTPDAFGVIATVTIVISFAEMLSDSGFQKYIIQRDFENKRIQFESMNVAFWTTLSTSSLLWFVIIIFRNEIAKLVGNEDLGIVIAAAGFSLPLFSLISIQMANYKRNLDFRTLFYMRIISVSIPFVVTIPLAILNFSYWSLIIGTIAMNIVNAVFLTIKSSWKPRLFYKFSLLKDMLSFSVWSLIEAISIWLTTYVGTFIVANVLSSYYLGLYNTTIITVNGILAIITTATTSVLFSSLSRLQNNEAEFLKVFTKFIHLISIIIFPLGVGIFIFRNLITQILLGEQWLEASAFVGVWGLSSSFTIVLGQYCSEIYRAKGKPKISLLVQLLHMVFLTPTIMISVNYGFESLIYAHSIIKLQLILANWLVIYFVFKISPYLIIKNVFPSFISAGIMGIIIISFKGMFDGVAWEFLLIIMSMVIYISTLMLFPKVRKELINLLVNHLISSTFVKRKFKKI